jgi:alpha-tubulin suppressor-like RCC1 family protein
MGGMHVLALTQDKRAVYSWGANRHGQLGRGTETDTESVGIIEALEGETIGNIPQLDTIVYYLSDNHYYYYNYCYYY